MNLSLEGLGIWGRMKSCYFNGIMPGFNHAWGASVLGMHVNHPGPDLLDDEKLVELKFFIRNPKPHKEVQDYRSKKKWTVNNKQVIYPQEYAKKGYWGMGLYELDRSVRSIRHNSINLEQYVLPSRELFIVKWDWMKQFPSSLTKGTRKDGSVWEDHLRYPKINLIPDIEVTYEFEDGKVHLTEGVDHNDFILDKLPVDEDCLEPLPF